MENIDNLILGHLRPIRTDLDGMKGDLRESARRFTRLETAVA